MLGRHMLFVFHTLHTRRVPNAVFPLHGMSQLHSLLFDFPLSKVVNNTCYQVRLQVS